MKNNFYNKIISLTFLFLVVCFFIFMFFYRSIKKNESSIIEAESTWQKEATRREEIKSLDQSVRAIEPERIQLESHFTKVSDVVPFLNTLEGLGQKVNAKASVTSVEVSSDNTKLLVEMKATGSFDAVFRFLTLLENSSYEMKMDSVDMHHVVLEEDPKNNTKVTRWELVLKIQLLTFIP